MTQLCENDACASSSSAAAEVAGLNIRLVDDLYFLRHILDMKPSSDDDSSNSNIEIHTSSPNSPPTPQRTRSRLLGHRQSMTGSSSIPYNTSSQNNNPHQTSPYSSPPISTSPNGYILCHPGMKDVPLWLKTLRLHKYTVMFQNLTYNEMMNLNERQLEMLKVTKGARKKILQSLEKLRERVSTLKMLDKILDAKSDLTFIISEIRSMMNTPICSYKPLEMELLDASAIDGCDVTIEKISEHNLPGHIIHITSRIHDILFEHGKIYDLEDEYLLKLLQIYEKICTHDSFNSKQRTISTTWKRTLRKVAVERNLLPPGNGHIGVGYAGFKRSAYTQQRMSSSTTRSSTTSPPESSCAISPPPMPQSYSAPPHSNSNSSSTASISAATSLATTNLPFDKLCEHPQGAALIQQLVELSFQIKQEDQKNEKNMIQSPQQSQLQHRYGGTQTPPGVSKERISISKSLSSPDNSRLHKPLTQEEKNAFMNQCRQDGHRTSKSAALPPTPPNWIPIEPTTTSRYHSRQHHPGTNNSNVLWEISKQLCNIGMTQHSSMPSTQWQYNASLPPQMLHHPHHPQQQQQQQQHLIIPIPTTPTTITPLESRRTCYPYIGRQSLSASRMPSSSNNSSGFSSGGSDRSSGAGSPTSSLIPLFPTKWSNTPQSSYNAEMCNNQNMPPVK
jgi:hypothetical protein